MRKLQSKYVTYKDKMHYLGGFFSILLFDYPLTFIYVWMKVTKSIF